jgi:hypothetical protein
MPPTLADLMLLHPSTDPEPADPRTERRIAWSGGRLQLFTERSPTAADREPRAFVLEFTGNGGRAEWGGQLPLHRFTDVAVESWTLNYPGFGGSDGPARLRSLGPAGLAAFDEICRIAAGRPVLLSGNSIGTLVALHVAAARPAVAGLVLRNPPPLRSLILGRHGWWNLWLGALWVVAGIPPELDGPATAAKVRRPAVFLSSTDDTLVPPDYQRIVIDAYAGHKTVVLLDGAGHNSALTADQEEAVAGRAGALLTASGTITETAA